MQVTTTLDRSGDVTCHKAGCGHLSKLPPADYLETFDADSKETVAGHVYADQARESDSAVIDYVTFIQFAPCVRLPLTQRVACRNCGGDGYTSESPACPACRGTGYES